MTTDQKLAEYKGFSISVNAQSQFIGTDSDGEEIATGWTLKELHDKLEHASKKNVRMRVWIKIRNYSSIKPGNLTSIKQTRGYGGETEYEARVSYDEGSWSQVRPSDVYPMNEENDKLVTEYQSIEKHALELHKASSELMKKMKTINIQELIK